MLDTGTRNHSLCIGFKRPRCFALLFLPGPVFTSPRALSGESHISDTINIIIVSVVNKFGI